MDWFIVVVIVAMLLAILAVSKLLHSIYMRNTHSRHKNFRYQQYKKKKESIAKR